MEFPTYLQEFVSVYRMHSLLPDQIALRDIKLPAAEDSCPPILEKLSKWEDLTDDEEVIEALRRVYGDDVEKLDLIVGLHAEKKIKGFAISETSFFSFVLMASRRLEADRFFTSNFNSKTYTDEGLEWVNRTESLKDSQAFPSHDQKLDEMLQCFLCLGFNAKSYKLHTSVFEISLLLTFLLLGTNLSPEN